MKQHSRISDRKPFQTTVYFEDEFGEEFLVFTSSNLSTSGMFIKSKLPFRSGTKVFLKFHLSQGSTPIRIAAEVMRFHGLKRGPGRKKSIEEGVGLKFLGLSASEFLRIKGFLDQI